ncbi:MAG: aldo/keto reductase [Deltaproteobacteria bacterium]|nr:aldo/keto reductase [Deltaproteobacteria bacterium]
MKRKIGLTGVEVNAIGLGAMPISIQGRPSEEQGIKVIQEAVHAGVNFIDTANVYCLDDSDIGHNERIIYKALKNINALQKVYIATKGGLIRPEGRWECNAEPQFLRKSCEKSLQDLHAESIFLYQLHAPDSNIPFEDSVGELTKLKEEGKIENIGLSNVNAEELNAAQEIVRIESVQNRCNPGHQKDLKNSFTDLCKKQNVTYIAYSPVGGGFHHKDLSHQKLFLELSKKYKTSSYCIILAWLLSKGEHVLPIPGASHVESILDSMKAAQVKLEQEDIQKIDNL